MIKLKLVKGLSYSGIIKATAKHPFVEVEDEAIAKEAVASGYFAVADGKETESADKTTEETEKPMQYGGKPLEKMNKSELETFAAYNNVDIKGCSTKNDIIDALKSVLTEEDLEGDLYYGSPTMVDLEQ